VFVLFVSMEMKSWKFAGRGAFEPLDLPMSVKKEKQLDVKKAPKKAAR